MHDSTRAILEYNAGRDPERLTRKLAAIAADPFSFFRGTNNLYAASLADSPLVHEAPRTLVCGDLHLENYGSFKGDNGLVYFDMNDFDEAAGAPFTVDLVRVLSSLQVAARGWKLADEDAGNLCRRFLETYAAALVEGKPRWVERATAVGIVRDLLRGLATASANPICASAPCATATRSSCAWTGVARLPPARMRPAAREASSRPMPSRATGTASASSPWMSRDALPAPAAWAWSATWCWPARSMTPTRCG